MPNVASNQKPEDLLVCNPNEIGTVIDRSQRLKSALWYSIGNTIDAISLEDDVNADSHYIGALTELVWSQIGRCNVGYSVSSADRPENAAQDLEAFAK